MYKCFIKWQEQRLFEKVFEELALECDLQDIAIDSTTVKMHKEVGLKKEKIGKSRGGNTTKIHVATDSLDNSVKVRLMSEQVHDVTIATQLFTDLKPKIIMAGAAYDSDEL